MRGTRTDARLRWLWRAAAVGLAAGHTWAAIRAGSMNEDGISYMDMGDAFLRGDWQTAVNAVWSPLYAVILGSVLRVVEPGMGREFAVVQLANFAIFLGTLVCFEFYWSRLVSSRPRSGSEGGETAIGLPPWAWWSTGYGLFIWLTTILIRLWAVTPDLLVMGLVFLAAGLLLRLEDGQDASTRRAALGIGLGAALGAAYLAKAVMLPAGILVLAAGGIFWRRSRGLLRSLGLAALTALVVAAPWMAMISIREGRPTFGEAGRLTYVRLVNGVSYPFWEPGVPGTGEPEHPPRIVWREPYAYEFSSPVGGTYPISYDPSYWYRGVHPRIDILDQARALTTGAFFYADLFARELGGVTAAILLLLFLRRRGPENPLQRQGPGALAAAGSGVLALYSLVYVEGRYIAPFLVLLLGGLLYYARLPGGDGSRRTMRAAGAVMALYLLLAIGIFNAQGFLKLTGTELTVGRATGLSEAPRPAGGAAGAATPGSSAGEGEVEAARALRAMGIGPGDEIAFVGYAFNAYFARLARIRVTRQILGREAAGLWAADADRFEAIVWALLQNGGKAVVSDDPPSGISASRWRRLGESRYWVLEPDTHPTAVRKSHD